MKKIILAITLIIWVTFPYLAFGDYFISWPLFQAFNDDGTFLSGGFVDTYECNTTDRKTTYSDKALTAANANPIELNTRGEADIYASGCTKLVITDSEGNPIEDTDYFGGTETSIEDGDGNTKIQTEESADENIIRFDISGTEQVILSDGSITPTTTDDIDLGSDTKRFEDLFVNRISGQPFPGFLMRPKFTYVESLDYDGGTVIFVVGETVTGAGGGTSVVVALSVGATAVTGTLYVDTRNATAYVNDEVLTGGTAGVAVANEISSKNAIIISPFVYYHCGTTEQLLYSDLNIAYEFVALATSDWSYLYFDDSVIDTAATSLITAAQLVDNTGEPLYNASKHGHYHQTTITNDLCFFGVLTDGSDNIVEFFHDGGDAVMYAVKYIQDNGTSYGNTWTDEDCSAAIPSFSTKAIITFRSTYAAATNYLHWRTNGQTDTNGHQITYVEDGVTKSMNTVDVITDSNQIIELYHSSVGAESSMTWIEGWYFPNGM